VKDGWVYVTDGSDSGLVIGCRPLKLSVVDGEALTLLLVVSLTDGDCVSCGVGLAVAEKQKQTPTDSQSG
jgi:hypothetical protein